MTKRARYRGPKQSLSEISPDTTEGSLLRVRMAIGPDMHRVVMCISLFGSRLIKVECKIKPQVSSLYIVASVLAHLGFGV